MGIAEETTIALPFKKKESLLPTSSEKEETPYCRISSRMGPYLQGLTSRHDSVCFCGFCLGIAFALLVNASPVRGDISQDDSVLLKSKTEGVFNDESFGLALQEAAAAAS